MTIDADERACAACECVEHKDMGRACDSCIDWYCDECWTDWPEDDLGEQRLCAECLQQARDIAENDDWHWRHR